MPRPESRGSPSPRCSTTGATTRRATTSRLCRYFDCRIEDLVEYVPDEQVEEEASKGHAQE
ncbi:helix-turn-helix domain-containing protein [Thioalkalivibrio paradoxus]|uniref:helix-turn-helix domain-containing protein n=1 Tax=Thioalkalivibrio paradoxus TaxID=108010 RepID=UPI001E32A8F0|nr:helix-turn-helix transcriptional regulator [Thioalkalivibrio paradoxus]